MNMERARISSVNGKSLGIILVLFILLVIVTIVFSSKSEYLLNNNTSEQRGSDSVDITEEGVEFQVINYSSYDLNLYRFIGDASAPFPSGALEAYTGENRIILTTNQNSSTSAEFVYMGTGFENPGRVRFVLERIVGEGPAKIADIITQGPTTAYVSTISPKRLIINDY